jgi:hypothetical protein
MSNGSIRVVSKRKGGVLPAAGETLIEIDRTSPIFGNRFILHDHRNDGERARVIAAFEAELDEDLSQCGPKSQELDRIAAMVRRGERAAFRCWCAPLRCHGDRLAEIVADRSGVAMTRGEQQRGTTWQQQLLLSPFQYATSGADGDEEEASGGEFCASASKGQG